VRVAINLRLYVKGEIGGMENYVRHIVGGIGANPDVVRDGLTIFALQSELDHIREFAPKANFIEVKHATSGAIITNELLQSSYDLYFCPLLVLDPLHVPIPSAITIPDLQHEYFPEFFDNSTLEWRRQTFRPSVFYADTIFTISEYSKSTIVDKLGADPAKIVVVGLDVDAEFRSPATIEAQDAFRNLAIPEPYIYFPANFWKHKNHSTLLRALKLLIEDGYTDLTLALTGASATGIDRIQAEVTKLKLAGNVKFLGYQPRPVIAEIYRHSICLAFPSLFEGFGIPILEAFHLGIPVVAARGTSCPEVAGDAAILVKEDDAADVAKGIRKLIDDPELRNSLAAKGRLRASKYSWREALTSTLQEFDTTIRRHWNPHIEVIDHPLVSIVTPTYNMAHFLEQTIESVLSQDYPRIEYIVMDGGSTDGTLDILRKYEHGIQFRSERDKGQAEAINKGFGMSTGEIFTFLNADDTYLPGAVSTAVKHLTANRSVGLVYGDAYHVREDGSIIAPYPTKPYDYDLLNRNCFICQPAAFMWRNAFESAGWMNQDLQTALDYDLWIRIAKLRPLMKIDGYLATSRMYRENKTVSRRKQVYEEIIRVVKTYYGFVPYDWVYGYAAYLIDRKDQIFDVSHPSALKELFALLLGSVLNPTQVTRYWAEWWNHTGLGNKFTGRWDDGWISREYECDLEAGADCDQIVVLGRHLAPIRDGLTLSFSLNGIVLEKTKLRQPGPFHLNFKCPPAARGRLNRLRIESDKIFRTAENGDHRRLSCLIDSIAAERTVSQTT
jgi:glycosyltransferase involved in cell wall biosynthesis